ncbi:MAG: DUF952 domain-containing protein [Acidimicrobiales bacterium]
MTPHKERIFHIATPDDAERLRGGGVLWPSSLETEGFVHCSTATQVVVTTARHFAAGAVLVLVELDAEAIVSELQWPEVYPGEYFPHLHAPLHPSAVIALHPWGPDDRLRWDAAPAPPLADDT